MALWMGFPLARSHTCVVSRWLVIPIAANVGRGEPGPGDRFADGRQHRACSTHPDCDKCCGISAASELAVENERGGETLAFTSTPRCGLPCLGSHRHRTLRPGVCSPELLAGYRETSTRW
jgi:hypothetical protein